MANPRLEIADVIRMGPARALAAYDRSCIDIGPWQSRVSNCFEINQRTATISRVQHPVARVKYALAPKHVFLVSVGFGVRRFGCFLWGNYACNWIFSLLNK